MVSLMATLVVVGGLIAYAVTTDSDISGFRYYGVIMALELLNVFVFSWFYSSNIVMLAGAVLGSLTAGIYLVADIQMLVAGSTRKIKVDDYIMASFSIYMDIINLFIEIVKIV